MLSIEERLAAVMTAPLDTVVGTDSERPPTTVVQRWDLPEADRMALVRWGLPTDQLMKPEFQPATEPLLVPNVAGEQERRLISPEQRLYDLGQWGTHDLTPRVGAVAGDGRVLGVRAAPLTADDFPAQLREHYKGFYSPAVLFINSSVAQFVEVTWRWRAAIELLNDLQEPPYTNPDTAFNSFVARVKACRRMVLTLVEAIDGAVRADEPDSCWGDTITDWG